MSEIVRKKDVPALYDLADASQYEYEDMEDVLDKFVQEIQDPIYRGLLIPRHYVENGCVFDEWKNGISHWTTSAEVAKEFSLQADDLDVMSSVEYLEDLGLIPHELVAKFWECEQKIIDEYFVSVVLILKDVPPGIPLAHLLKTIQEDKELAREYRKITQDETPTELDKLIAEQEVTLHGYKFFAEASYTEEKITFIHVTAKPCDVDE